MPTFNISVKYDACLLPYSPISENDRLEIRAQVFNSDTYGEVKVNFYFDTECIGCKIIGIDENSYGFANLFTDVKGKTGKHNITVLIEAINGNVLNSKVELPLEILAVKNPTLDGGFVMLGPPNDRMPCDTYRKELKSFTDDDWKLFSFKMFEMGADCIIINVAHQYLTLKNKELTAHYPSELLPKSDIAAEDPISAILSVAEKEDKKVFIGVGNQFGHKGTKEEISELYQRYKHFTSFYGWYFATELRMDISDEVEFQKWNLYNYLYDAAHELCPVKPILISPMAMYAK